MNEYLLLWWGALNLLVILAVATAYSLGGRSGKWRRRFMAPAFLVGYVWITVFFLRGRAGYLSLLAYPAYAAAWSVGYGVNSQLTRWLGTKTFVRLVTGTAYVLAALPIALASGPVAVELLLVSWLPMAALVTYLGVRNPLPAAQEELLIATLTTLLVPFLPFVVAP